MQQGGGVKFSGSHKTCRGNIYECGDVLLSNIRPYLRKIWKADCYGTCSSDVLVIRPSNKVLGDFLYFCLNSDVFFDYVSKHAKGTKMPRGDKKSIFKYALEIPSQREQSKISFLFTKLEELIKIQQRKLSSFEEIKKGFLQKLFVNLDDGIPEYRFSEFNDRWQIYSLSEVTQEFQSGQNIKSDQIHQTGLYPVYGGNGIRGYTSTYNHDGNYAIIGRQGAQCGNVSFSSGKAFFTEHAVAVKAKEGFSTEFLVFILRNLNLSNYSDQSAQPGLAVGKLKKLKAKFPCYSEQLKISDILFKLEKQIDIIHRELELLNIVKKALFQQMFI